MPLFEFACRTCGRRFEAFVTAARAAACPGCQSNDLEKLISTFRSRTSGGDVSASSRSPFT